MSESLYHTSTKMPLHVSFSSLLLIEKLSSSWNLLFFSKSLLDLVPRMQNSFSCFQNCWLPTLLSKQICIKFCLHNFRTEECLE